MQREITHINFAKGFRGGERQTLLLIEALANRGYQQRILTRQHSILAQKLEGIAKLEIIPISKPYLLHLSKVKKATLMHAHETKGAQFALVAHLLYKIPYLVTRRVDIAIKDNLFNRALYSKAHTTVVLSSAIKKRLYQLNPTIHTTTIPSAITPFTNNPQKIEVIKKRFKDKFLIGNIGALEEAKGQQYIIEIATQIEKNYPNIHIIFLGKGKDEGRFKAQASHLNNITFEGFVDNVGDYIACFDLFVFPTQNEGLGSILLDVMNGQVPIIASNVGGIPDIITHNQTALLIKANNSQALYQSIEKLYHDEMLRKQLANSAFETMDNYSVETMTEHYIKLYEKGKV